MSKRDRHDNERRGDRRDSQPDDEQQRRPAETDAQEGDSLTALKAILSKVAALLNPLQLTQEESIRLVEQLYGSVLETDVRLAGEADDTRKSSVLAQIQNTNITRENGKIVVQYASAKDSAPQADAGGAGAAPAASATEAPPPRPETPSSTSGAPSPVAASEKPANVGSDPADTAPGKSKNGTGSRGNGRRNATRTAAAKPARTPKTEQGNETAETVPQVEPQVEPQAEPAAGSETPPPAGPAAAAD